MHSFLFNTIHTFFIQNRKAFTTFREKALKVTTVLLIITSSIYFQAFSFFFAVLILNNG